MPGANGQGETIEKAKNNLQEAIELILEDRRQDIFFNISKHTVKRARDGSLKAQNEKQKGLNPSQSR